jgi:hypothetical protein
MVSVMAGVMQYLNSTGSVAGYCISWFVVIDKDYPPQYA